MVFNQLRGVMCAATNALPSDAGTRVLGASPQPGAIGRDAGHTLLDEDERRWIRQTYGYGADGTPMDLESLRFYRDLSMRDLQSATQRYGAQSKQARWHEAVVAQYARLIREAEAARTGAASKLRETVKASDGRIGEGQKTAIKAAVVDTLKEARKHAEAGRQDAAAQSAAGVVEALQAVSRADKAALTELIRMARLPGSQVTEADLQKPLVDMLSNERQKQLAGIPDAPGEADAGALMADALAISTELRKQKLRLVLKNKGSNEEIKAAVAGVLGGERQRQLLGMADDAGDSSTSDLVTEALDTFHQRSKAALNDVLQRAKQGNVTREQIAKAVAEVLGAERQRQLLGASEKADEELSRLLSEAADLDQRVGSTPKNRGNNGGRSICFEPAAIIGRDRN